MYDRLPPSSPLPDGRASNRRTHPGWAKASAMGYPGWATASAMGYSSVYFTAYDCIVRGMCEATCELLNPNLCEGKFASAFLCKVKFDREVGALRLHGDSRGCVPRRGCATTPCSGGGARLAADEPPVATRNSPRRCPPSPHCARARSSNSGGSGQRLGAVRLVVAIIGRVVSADVVELVFLSTAPRLRARSRTRRRSTARAARDAAASPGIRKVGAAGWRSGGWPRQRGLRSGAEAGAVVGLPAIDARAARAAAGRQHWSHSRSSRSRGTWQYVSDLVRIREVFTRTCRARSVARWKLRARRGGDRSSQNASRRRARRAVSRSPTHSTTWSHAGLPSRCSTKGY